ncbi:undecaprenyldiphospho-muramoylpentapeptide beta-N-acetylglucosaminyltransferase [Spirochaetia bacterium 38H-sp]|uniref:UDP-N-acetylglucosamine--N-acetylmuramyl-(pentapeptide) pyrophosphoryl-undecaprenol N-acetylglucosamine transferase n=1 Tax=Rarispira pelagica TaxID=3141764 RepID=A0ABU9UDS6_9SPIR
MRIVYTGGGTGGHVFPAVAVHSELEKRVDGLEAFWIGSSSGPERGWVEDAGIVFYGVFSGKLRRYFSLCNVLDVFKVFIGFLQSFFILLRLRPDVLFSKGGYVAVPPVVAAKVLGIPVVIHESDFDPGLATRITCRFARKILLTYEETVSFFAPEFRDRCVATGNPIRASVLDGSAERAGEFFPLDDRPLVLVLGGSSGARQVNELVWAVLPRLLEHVQVIHQAGAFADEAPVYEGYHCVEFMSYELAHVLARADVVVSRAGAGAVAEFAALGKACVFIPLGKEYGSRGDQVRNASYLAGNHAAVVLAGDDANPDSLFSAVMRLVSSPSERSLLSERIASFSRPDAASAIADVIVSCVQHS